MEYLVKAIQKLRPGASWTIENDIMTWLDKVQTQPRQVEIDNMIKIIEQEEKVNDYKIQRKKEYDKLNQFELIFDDIMNDTSTFQRAIEKIKRKYPKGK